VDLSTVAGLVLAIVAVFGGFFVEGGQLSALVQPTAGLIVVGGTLGAVCVQFPLAHLKRAARGVMVVFFAPKIDLAFVLAELVRQAQKARREGIVSLERDAEETPDPFMRKALNLAVDGSESKMVREAMEVELGTSEEEGMAGAKVFAAGGGYAPTVGILGAVLGLIHVMQNLTDPGKLGAGIAVAFVATVYGVGLANLVLLPMSGKLKLRHQQEMMRYELIIEGVCSIVDGENPRIIEEKLRGFVGADLVEVSSTQMRKAA
jgi:chemotaxis protein MotA